MVREDLFPLPVWRDVLHEISDEELLGIKNYCINYFATETGRVRSNKGGRQSHDLNFNEIKDHNMLKLYNVIYNRMEHCNNDYGFDIKMQFSNLWININDNSHYNDSHYHSGCLMSGVFYVSCPENCGNVNFTRPNQIEAYLFESLVDYNKRNFLTWEAVQYTPMEKQLLVFPAWAKHGVTANLSNQERISIAFNYGMISRQ